VSAAADSGEALVVDLGEAVAGARLYVDSRAPVLAYLDAMRAVKLGARPIAAGGGTASYDPLEKRPAAARLLYATQEHAERLGVYLGTLHGWAGGGMKEWVGLVVAQVEVLRDVLGAIPDGAAASESQARQIGEAAGLAEIYTRLIGQAARTIREGVKDFLGHLIADHQALAGGETAVAALADQVAADARDAALKLIGPLDQGLAKGVLEIGAALYGELNRLGQQLDQALVGHSQIGGGVSAIANAVETIFGKYAAAQRAVARAGAADLPAVVRRLEPVKAIRFWQDFLRFLANSAL
jgi:hypothetical protein